MNIKVSEINYQPVVECSCCGKLHNVHDLPEFLGEEMMGLLMFNCECKSTVSVRADQYKDIILNNMWATKEYAKKVDDHLNKIIRISFVS